MDLIGFRRRILGRDRLVSDDRCNSPDKACPAACLLKHILNDICRRRLPLGARQTDGCQLLGRIVKVRRRQICQCVTRRFHQDHRNIFRDVSARLLPFRHDHLRSFFHRIGDVLVPVSHSAHHAYEHSALRHLSGIVDHIRYFRIHTALQQPVFDLLT